MNVILLHSEYRHVLANHLSIFRVVSCKKTNIFKLFRDHSTVKLEFAATLIHYKYSCILALTTLKMAI